jgi:serpin B
MKRAAAFLLISGLAGCAAVPPPEPAEREEARAEFPTGPETVAQGSTDFGLSLYKRLGEENGNIFLSPTSLSTAFGLAYAGARGETAQQMAEVLRFPGPPERLHSQMGEMLGQMRLDLPGRKLTVANALWVEQKFPLRAEYRQTLSRFYGAEPTQVNFVSRPDSAVAQINRWAEENTAGKIRNLLSRDDINDLTRLYLTNTVYFKGDWLKKFEKHDTRQQPFHPRGGAPFETAFMNQTGRFRHLDKGAFQALELPYKGEELSMMVFLPKQRDGLPALEREMDGARLNEWVNELRSSEPTTVELSLPKLKLEEKYRLKPQLIAMGMRRAFTDKAEFEGISSEGPLFIYSVIHQTFLAVDEEGTEAAAATAIGIQLSGARLVETRFIADRPFFFLIRDNRSGSVVFMGRIEMPPVIR